MRQHDLETRRLSWEGCVNVRDLGGLPTRAGSTTRHGVVVRSDSPHRLTEGGRQALVDYGVRTIVDLRLPDEAADHSYPFVQPGSHGIRYVSISFIDPEASGPVGPIPLAEDYKGMLDRFRAQVAAIVQAIATAPDGGVCVHCAAGKDRTGLIVALLLDLANVPRELIAADYALSSVYLQERTLEWLASVPEKRAERESEVLRGTTLPDVMLEVLAHLDERYGGSEGYLSGGGCRAEDLAELRRRLVAPE